MIDHRINAYRLHDTEPGRAWNTPVSQRKIEEAQGLLERGHSLCFWGSAAAVTASYIVSSSASNSADQAAQNQANISNRQMDMSQQQWDYYKQIYQPVETSLANDATTGLTPDYTGVTGRASANVNAAFDTADANNQRSQSRLGINPNSGDAIATNRLSQISRAQNDAAAQTGAYETERQNILNTNFNRKLAVADVGKGIPSSAMAGANAAATQQGNVANMYAGAAQNTATAIGGLPWGKLTNSGGTTTRAPVTDMSTQYNGGSPYSSQSDFSNGSLPSPAISSGGSGTYYAEGGLARGPGTPTSDSIPAHLSTGEFVVPADVVRRKGLEFFEKLVAKNHHPLQGGLSFMRPGEHVQDAHMCNGGRVGYANGGMVRPAPKQSSVVLREKTRKALANIGL